jgi:glutathione synthase/RimK-type ligase-like ATP-grasp enzyme
MPKIAFVTSSDLPQMPTSDALTKAGLEKLGFDVESVRWDSDDPTKGYDALVFRSCWNYHLKPNEFWQWAEALGREAKCVLNPVEMVLWNLDKTYLLQLAEHVPVVPTQLLCAPTVAAIASVGKERGWPEMVIKPTIGNTSYLNQRLLAGEEWAMLEGQSLPAPLLVQPYLRSIETDGEFALVFFDGLYSHAVVKRAVAGEYRVQEEFGGSATPVQPSVEMLGIAQAAVDFVAQTPTYARVDLVLGAEGPMVMELEVAEPELYIDRVPGSAATFAAAVRSKIG